MQVTCPQCGTLVESDQINIQQMAAVCPNCHTVFQFAPSASKVKRRKVKQPSQMISDESGGRLTLAFRTNFRLDKNETFISTAVLSAIFTFVTFILFQAGQEAVFIPVSFGLCALCLYYVLALMVYNKTHIEIEDETLTISRKPLPGLAGTNTINLGGIESVHFEETPMSKKEGYDTPRYNVWAETVDGSRRLIVSELVEDYAIFVSQRLNEFLAPDTDVSRLLEEESEIVSKADTSKFSNKSG